MDHGYLLSWTEPCNTRRVRPRDQRDVPGVKQNIGGREENRTRVFSDLTVLFFLELRRSL